MSKRLFLSASYGIIAAFFIILIAALIMTTLLKFTSMTETSLSKAPLIISLIALFIGGLIAGIKMKEKGLMVGVSTGLLYSALIYLILFLGFDRDIGLNQYMLAVANMAVTGMGGVIGVNVTKK
ncbi:TIGR04086 family membrane protein [Camelliibacillus cellulosilyticus]|uniref:TIGR04086 family membrane protein n=1 Tax=Camelliibacillus cellulosilyticus TaxID=2174486 RepID=A0ABV9GIJ7_9BACL